MSDPQTDTAEETERLTRFRADMEALAPRMYAAKAELIDGLARLHRFQNEQQGKAP